MVAANAMVPNGVHGIKLRNWNMSPENIVLGDVTFGLTKSGARLPSYVFSFCKKRTKSALGMERVKS